MNPLKRFWNWIRKTDLEKDRLLNIAISVINKIRLAAESKVLTTLTEVTKTEKDDLWLLKIRVGLNHGLDLLNILKEESITDEGLMKAVKDLGNYKKNKRNNAYAILAGSIYSQLKNEVLSKAIHETQKYYLSTK